MLGFSDGEERLPEAGRGPGAGPGIGVCFWFDIFSKELSILASMLSYLYPAFFLRSFFLQLLLLLAPWYFLICFYLFAIAVLFHLSCHLSTSLLFYSLIISSFTYYSSSSSIYIYPLSLFSVSLHVHGRIMSQGAMFDPLFPIHRSLELCRYRCLQMAMVLVRFKSSQGLTNWPIKVQDSQYNCIITISCPLQRTAPEVTFEHHKHQNNVYHILPSPRESFYDGNSKSISLHQLRHME